LVGIVLGIVVWLWALSWRRRVHSLAKAGTPRVYAFWHGQQMGLVGLRARPTVVMVSRSRDGELQASVLQTLGFEIVRGSSSRGGTQALRALVSRVMCGNDAVFAVDGPRGPLGEAKPGAAFAAYRAQAKLVPVAAAASRTLRLSRAWDRFEIPLPFSRVAVVFGAELNAKDALRDGNLLRRALEDARALAEQRVDGVHERR
jgi:hypothetical protein